MATHANWVLDSWVSDTVSKLASDMRKRQATSASTSEVVEA